MKNQGKYTRKWKCWIIFIDFGFNHDVYAVEEPTI